MEEKRYEELEVMFEAWSFGLQQDVVTLLRRAKRNGISFDEYEEYVQERKIKDTGRDPKQVLERTRKRKEQNERFLKLLPDCPKCGHHPYELLPVSGCKGKANVYGYKSMEFCNDCGHYEYSVEPYGIRYNSILESEIKG